MGIDPDAWVGLSLGTFFKGTPLPVSAGVGLDDAIAKKVAAINTQLTIVLCFMLVVILSVSTLEFPAYNSRLMTKRKCEEDLWFIQEKQLATQTSASVDMTNREELLESNLNKREITNTVAYKRCGLSMQLCRWFSSSQIPFSGYVYFKFKIPSN
jgi:hypothetical protein